MREKNVKPKEEKKNKMCEIVCGRSGVIPMACQFHHAKHQQ